MSGDDVDVDSEDDDLCALTKGLSLTRDRSDRGRQQPRARNPTLRSWIDVAKMSGAPPAGQASRPAERPCTAPSAFAMAKRGNNIMRINRTYRIQMRISRIPLSLRRGRRAIL